MYRTGLLVILLLILSGCTENVEKFMTEQEALSLVQERVRADHVTWKATFSENEEIEINNIKNTYAVWIIEATYPFGNKEIYTIDAITGTILVLTEQEAPDK